MARIRLAESDAGRAVAVGLGDTIEITLAEIPTTGYRWHWTLDPGVRLVLDEYGAASPGAPGQSAERRLIVEVEGGGRLHLRAELRQEWEPDARRRDLTFELNAQ